MHNLAIWHLAIITLIVAAVVVPVVKILHRLGYSGWWAALAPISPLNVIGLWVLAYARWPGKAV
jgi:hypothetical protein